MPKYKTLENYGYAGIAFTQGHIVDDEIDSRLTKEVVRELKKLKIIESIKADKEDVRSND